MKIAIASNAILLAQHNEVVALDIITEKVDMLNRKESPIEERSADEVKGFRDYHWAAHGMSFRNPAFDVTPAELITGLITEKGVVLQPNLKSVSGLFLKSK